MPTKETLQRDLSKEKPTNRIKVNFSPGNNCQQKVMVFWNQKGKQPTAITHCFPFPALSLTQEGEVAFDKLPLTAQDKLRIDVAAANGEVEIDYCNKRCQEPTLPIIDINPMEPF